MNQPDTFQTGSGGSMLQLVSTLSNVLPCPNLNSLTLTKGELISCCQDCDLISDTIVVPEILFANRGLELFLPGEQRKPRFPTLFQLKNID